MVGQMMWWALMPAQDQAVQPCLSARMRVCCRGWRAGPQQVIGKGLGAAVGFDRRAKVGKGRQERAMGDSSSRGKVPACGCGQRALDYDITVCRCERAGMVERGAKKPKAHSRGQRWGRGKEPREPISNDLSMMSQ